MSFTEIRIGNFVLSEELWIWNYLKMILKIELLQLKTAERVLYSAYETSSKQLPTTTTDLIFPTKVQNKA